MELEYGSVDLLLFFWKYTTHVSPVTFRFLISTALTKLIHYYKVESMHPAHIESSKQFNCVVQDKEDTLVALG